MPSRQIQKLPGTLRRIFAAAAAAVLASQFGAATLLGMATDRTAEEAARLGLNEARLSKVAQAAFNIHYPEDRAAYLVPMLQGFFSVGAKLHDENTFARKRNENYEFYGMAFKHPLFGYDGLLDRATFHATSKFAQCNIIISSDALRLDKVKRMLTGMDSRQVANFPGEIKDYQKIFLLHELAHCRQIPSTDIEMLETGADIASLSDYLAHGGNKDVARAIMYGRVINGVMAYLSDADAESGGRLYAMGPILNHRFFGGPAITAEGSPPRPRNCRGDSGAPCRAGKPDRSLRPRHGLCSGWESSGRSVRPWAAGSPASHAASRGFRILHAPAARPRPGAFAGPRRLISGIESAKTVLF